MPFLLNIHTYTGTQSGKIYREKGPWTNYFIHMCVCVCRYIYIYRKKSQINDLNFHLKKQKQTNKKQEKFKPEDHYYIMPI